MTKGKRKAGIKARGEEQASKSIRFASLIRVSTDKQSEKGLSLVTQRKDNERDAMRLGGEVVSLYGGSEHGMPGFEKLEVDRLLSDAAKGLWDAVIVKSPCRWSRDNDKSREGLDTLFANGKLFYVGTLHMDLALPSTRLFLNIQAAVDEFSTLIRLKAAIDSKIELSRQGVPAVGRLPYGRHYDRRTGKWSIDESKQAVLIDIAGRYLAGEGLDGLAVEYGFPSRGHLRKTLTELSGDTWPLHFKCSRLQIEEVVPMAVPALLDKVTVRALQDKFLANRTYLHGRPKHLYLLQGRCFCGVCGFNLTGCIHGRKGQKYRYYEHGRDSVKHCPIRPRITVSAQGLEDEVFEKLFSLLGDIPAIRRSIHDAVPQCAELVKKQKRLRDDLASLERSRERLLSLVAKEAVTMQQAENQLKGLAERESILRRELDIVDTALAEVPSEAELDRYVESIETAQGGRAIWVVDGEGNSYEGGNDIVTRTGMTYERKRALVDAVFDGAMVEGKPAGVYIFPAEGTASAKHRPKRWQWKLVGRLDFELLCQQSESTRPKIRRRTFRLRCSTMAACLPRPRGTVAVSIASR